MSDFIQDRVKALSETRARVWEEAKSFLTDIKGQEMSAEQRAQWDRYNSRIDDLATEMDGLIERNKRETEAAGIREAQAAAFGRDPEEKREATNLNMQLRAWVRGDARLANTDEDGKPFNGITTNIRGVMRERELLRLGASPDEIRALAWDTGSVASAVPTILDRQLYEVLEANIAALRLPTTRITSDSGAPMDFTKVTAHAIATQVSGQGTTLAGTDPTFGKLTLTPTKHGELIKLANEVVSDSGHDVVGFIARDIGRAVGRQVNTVIMASIVGGVVTGASGTVATGGSLITPTYNNLVDLQYSVADAYRSGGNAGWLARDATAGALRKLRDGAGGTEGSPLWQPTISAIAGQRQPDTLLGDPFFTDPGVASLASNAKVLFYGDWNGYYLRTVGDVMVERNDSVGFATDEVFFRGKWRAAGGYQDLTAINLLKQSV